MRGQGSAGGHHGLEDVIFRLGIDQFARCRVGIGPAGLQAGADYVLSRPAPEERGLLDEGIRQSRDAILYWIEQGLDKTMTQFNRGD